MNREEIILIWYGAKQLWIQKNRIVEVLNKVNTKRYAAMWNTIHECFHREFLGLSNIILENIDNVNTIQIYQDGVVRLHLNHGHYEKPKSIIFNNAEQDEITILTDFCK